MEWDKDNVNEIVKFINKELLTGRAMNNIELEEFGANERVIHKRLTRIGYKKIDNQYVFEGEVTSNITVKPKPKKERQESIITSNSTIDMDKLAMLLDNMEKLLELIPKDNTSNITSVRSNQNEVRSLRIDTGLYEAIRKRASRDNDNISAIVNKALEDYLMNYL